MKQLESQCSQLRQELVQTRTLVQEGNYKIDNFDAVKRYGKSSLIPRPRERKEHVVSVRGSKNHS